VISSASGDNLISGTAQIGTKVTLFTANANAAIATVTVSSQGKWSYALSSANITSIGQGEGKTITAKATDAVGNISDSSDAFPFEVDTSAPKVNAILIESAEGIQNSFLNKDDIVTAKVTMSEAVKVSGAPTLKLLVGTTSVNATYDAIASSDEYLVFNYKIQANQSDADGISIPGSALTLGTGVSITDLAGNKAVVTSSAVSNNAAYKVDTTIAKPTITEVGGTDKIVVSSTASDAVVKGTAEANAVVIIRTGTGPSLTPLGTVTASSTGSWSYSLSPANVASIGYGTGRSVTATATDPAGNLSDTSAPFSFAAYDTLLNGSTANETINGTDGVDSLNGAAGNDIITGKAGGDFIALGAGKDTLVFGGSGSPGSMVISAASVLANLGRDSITDYSVADDSIQLSQAAFGSLATGATGALSSSKFTTVASATTAITRDYRDGGFLYNSGTGDLLYTTANLSNQAINSLLFAGDSANAAIIANFVNKPALVSTEFSVTP
jgi:Ca2+-binding RTX toxin-like protein